MKPIYLAVPLLLFCGGGAFADVTLKLLDPPNTGGANAGGVYTSPYNFSVSDGTTTTTTQLVCDDFVNDIYVNETWNATVTTLSQLSASSVQNLMYGANSTITPPSVTAWSSTNTTAQNYALAAVLVAQLMALPDLTSDAAKGYSFAIWDVFDKAAGDPLGNAGTDLSVAESLVTAATTAGTVNLNNILVNGQSISSVTVYTPTSFPNSPAFQSNAGGDSVPQEFLRVSMPEPSYPGVLALDLLAAAGLILFFKRRLSSKGKLNA